MQLKWIIFARTALLLTGMLVTITILYLVFSVHRYREESKALWGTRAAVLADEMDERMLFDDRVGLLKLLYNEVAGNETLAYAFITKNGQEYVSTFESGVPAALLHHAHAANTMTAWEFEDQNGRVMYDLADASDPGKAILHLGLNRSVIDQQIRPLLTTIIALSVGTMVIGILLCFVLARRTTREVDILVEAVRIYGEVREADETAIHATSSEVTALVQSFKQLSLERKQAEQKILLLNAELERRVQERTAQLATSNQELDAFAYSVSHDLRAPLRGIDGFSLALMEDYGDRLDDEAKSYLSRIRNGCVRMGRLIDDLLHLSRITRAELVRREVDLSALVSETAEELRQLDPQRQVEWVIPSGILVTADPKLIRAVIDNLVGNAWKFTGHTPQARIIFGTRPGSTGTVYFIKDNGAGFDMRYGDKLFNAFQRLHKTEEFAGTGIGLATVHRVINRHGGRVWAEGAVGQGATFYFTLGEET